MGKKNKGAKSLDGDERKLAKKLKKAAKQEAAAANVPAAPDVAAPGAPARSDKPAKRKTGGARKAKPATSDVEAAPAPRQKVPAPPHVAPGNFAVSVPVVALKVADGQLVVAVAGKHLPTAALGVSEQLPAAASRALATVGLSSRSFRLLPLATDLEGPASIAASWVALGRPGADDGTWVPVADAPGRAAGLARAAVERLATLLETTTIGAALCADEFTVGELREAYAAVWGADPDGRNFHRKVTGVADFLVETGERTSRSGGRPAMLYRAGAATQLNPAVTRVG